MIYSAKIYSAILLSLCLGVVSACITEDGASRDYDARPPVFLSPEALLAAEGTLDLVEENAGLSPEEMHMRARKQVDPSRPSSTKNYTLHTAKADIEEDVHFRVLRLKNADADADADAETETHPHKDKKWRLFKAKKTQTLALKPPRKPSFSTILEGDKPARTERKTTSPFKSSNLATLFKKKKPSPARALFASEPQESAYIVSRLRMGEHPDKTRFVLDVSGAVEFTTTLDNKAGLLLIELPDTTWNATRDKVLENHPFLKGYTLRQTPDGRTILEIGLKAPARLIFSTMYEPTKGYKSYRIIFDLGAL